MSDAKRKDNTTDLILVIISAVGAPLLAHLLSFVPIIDSSMWTSERLLVLYFAGVVGYILSDKLIRLFNNSSLPKRGYLLERSDAIPIAVWALAPTIVCWFYGSFEGSVVVLILYLGAMIILWHDKEEVVINAGILVASGFVAIAIWALTSFSMPVLSVTTFLASYIAYLLVLVLVCSETDSDTKTTETETAAIEDK